MPCQSFDPASQFTYGYDRLYRLSSVTGADGPRSYGYDPVGNRLTKVAGATTTYTYDRADRITTAGGAPLTVDANGNLTVQSANTFGYDQANRMTTATVAGSPETYAYDGDGTRFSRQVGANPATRYVSDPGGSLPVTIDDGTRKYVWGMGLAYAVQGSTVEVYHADRLESVRNLTDGTGAVVATYRADEWGIPMVSSGGSTQPFGFTGEPADATGLMYLRARYYSPGLARFTSRDTWPGVPTMPQTLNRCSYVNDNPVTYRDPSGLAAPDTLDLRFGPDKEIIDALDPGTTPDEGDPPSVDPFDAGFEDPLGTFDSGPLKGCKVLTVGLGFGLILGGVTIDVASGLAAAVSGGTALPFALGGIASGTSSIITGWALVNAACPG